MQQQSSVEQTSEPFFWFGPYRLSNILFNIPDHKSHLGKTSFQSPSHFGPWSISTVILSPHEYPKGRKLIFVLLG